MDVNEIKEIALVVVFGVLFILGAIIFFFFAIDFFVLFLMVFVTAFSKCFWGSEEEVVDEVTSISSSSRRLNLLEIISHLFWFHALCWTGDFFIWAIIPVEFQPNLKAYDDGEFKWSRKTPFVFKYLLNNPSKTAADFAETFTRRVLVNLGFQHLSSSSNPNYKYQGCYDSRVYYFEHALSKSCFARELIDKYNSINWAKVGVPPAPTQFNGLEKRILRFHFAPEDNEWVEPFNNWFKWYTKTVHKRIFPSQDYQVFEATVQFLFFSFLHDLVAPFISWFGLFGITSL